MSQQEQSHDVAFDEACRFIIRLGEAAHGYGSTAARLEVFLSRLTTAFGYRGVFRSTPTEIVFAFQEDDNHPQRTHLATLPGTGLDLDKLAQVGELVDAVVAGQVSIAEGTARLDEIKTIPHPWGTIANAASYAFCGAGFAILMSGGWWDVLFATLFSLVVFGMVVLAGRFGERTAEWLPLSTAVVAGALTAGTKILLPELNLVLVTLSAILILIPGYPVSVGIVELVSNHVVSGMAKLMSGLVYLAKQFAGAWLGVGLVSLAWKIPQADAGAPVDPVWLWLAIPLLIVGAVRGVSDRSARFRLGRPRLRRHLWRHRTRQRPGRWQSRQSVRDDRRGRRREPLGRKDETTDIDRAPPGHRPPGERQHRIPRPGRHRCRAGRHRRATASPDVCGRSHDRGGLARRQYHL